MSFMDLWMALGLGVAASLHCTQMCGPIVVAYSLGSGGGLRAHLFYNLGRIATYSLLGALAGLLGTVMGLAGRVAGVEKPAMIVAGALMIVAGILTAGVVPSSALVRIGAGGVAGRFSRAAGRLVSSRAPLNKLALGALVGFLPCGLVYAALLKAMAAATPLAGAATMAAFGAGTAGALVAIGAFSSVIGARLRRWSNPIAALSMLVVGGLLLWHGVKPMTMAHGGGHH